MSLLFCWNKIVLQINLPLLLTEINWHSLLYSITLSLSEHRTFGTYSVIYILALQNNAFLFLTELVIGFSNGIVLSFKEHLVIKTIGRILNSPDILF